MKGKKLICHIGMVLMVIGSVSPVLAEDNLEIGGVVVYYLGQGAGTEKETARESDGSISAEKDAKDNSYVTAYKGEIEVTYNSDDITARVAFSKRSDEYWASKETPKVSILWQMSPGFSLKAGHIEPDESNLMSWASGTNAFGLTTEGYAFHGLYTRIDEKPGLELRYHLSPYHSFGFGLFGEDIYYDKDIDEISDSLKAELNDTITTGNELIYKGYCNADGTVTASGISIGMTNADCSFIAGATAMENDVTKIANASTDGEGSAWHIGFVGPVFMEPMIVLTTAYISSIGNKSDGGPTNQSTGSQLSLNFHITESINLILDYGNSVREAYTGVSLDSYNPGEEINIKFEITETALQLSTSDLGPGKLIMIYGISTYTTEIYGETVKSDSGVTTDTDLVYDIALNDKAGIQIAFLNKKDVYDDSDKDEVVNQFFGLGLYSFF